MTFMPGPFSEESSEDDTHVNVSDHQDDSSTPHPALWVCQLISEPIIHYGLKKGLKDKRATLSSPSLRTSHSFSTSPSLNLSEIRSLLESSYAGDSSLDLGSSTSLEQLQARPTVSAPSPLRKSLTTCWSEESIVSPRKPSRWKALKRMFKRKK